MRWLIIKLGFIMSLLTLLGWAAACPYSRLVPIQQGTAEGFWAAATGVREEGRLGGATCLDSPIDGWFLFSSGHMHGSDVFRVEEAAVLASTPLDVGQLGGPGKLVPEWTAAGYEAWQKVDPERRDARLLLFHLKASRRDWWMNAHPDRPPYGPEEDFTLGVAWQRMETFPLVQVGEWAYFSSLVIFGAWPWLRKRGRWSWAVHAALVPPLVFLPFYLGYCGWMFTSAGPGGGVFYPFVLYPFRELPWTSLDTFVVQHVPQVLAPLTGPVGPLMSLSGGRAAGPVVVGALGLCLGMLVFVVMTFCRRPKEKRAGRLSD